MNTRHSPERELFMMAISRGVENGTIGAARLMAPEEISAVLKGRQDLQGKVGGWCLCTDVPTGMWHHLLAAQTPVVPTHLTVVETRSGRTYLSVVIQADQWQHRVCVPLAGVLTAQWLATLLSGVRLQLSVAGPESTRALISFADVAPDTVAKLRNVNTCMPMNWRGLLEESMEMLAWNASVARADRAVSMPEPSSVSLSLLFPEEVQAELERISDASIGRKAS